MAKGDDAIMRKKNRHNRKRVRSSESAVSARAAAIIASKRRRKAGQRRICEGMCYTLPTPDDPYNERHGKKEPEKNKKKKSKDNPSEKQNQKKMLVGSGENLLEQSCPSKFLIVCLNAIKNAWREEGELEEGDISSWGLDLWRCCSNGLSNVLDTSGSCGTREQIAWTVSVVSDIIARKEKQGILVSSPYLLYIVPTQEKAVQVRSICKPLKALGIHAVSLHPGASIQHQLRGLKSCEPEFLISTPGRLLELISLKAVDISSVSLLVIDGLGIGCSEEMKYADKLNSIKETITSNPHVMVFSNHCDQMAALAHNLLGGPITRLSLNDSVTSRSAFISQNVHHCASQEQKIAKIQEILLQSMRDEGKLTKMLLVMKSESKNELTASLLNLENCTISNTSSSGSFSLHHREKVMRVVVKDKQSLQLDKVENFEMVLVADLPSAIEEYVEILTRIARHSVTGVLHSIFCQADAHLTKSLIDLLTECKQAVPQFLMDFDSLVDL
ncbi:ATP-dependent RNA helicase DBP2 [Carex littledalei]|uniref:ATP-dependent RNA helicase DBP2 n=1 Tax=Carex littledalei TaxID=544730 RepID=A0A833R7X1_9POAL|nr:ATP-dependent RNA helicase DBP2 [Carex littledalei]